MGRFWSLLFLMVPIFGIGSFVWAMFGWWPMRGHWLPENINVHGGVIDNLFYFILVLTGVIFLATGLVLFWFLWKYDAARNPQPVMFTHGSHTLEVVWSIIPSATLVFIAIYQMNAWADSKMRNPSAFLPDGRPDPNVVEIEAMEQRLDAMLRAVKTVQAALDEFYASLSAEQKERFNRLGPAQG